MTRYYFISFMYGESEKTLCNDVINENPSEWQKYANKSHPGQYVLTDWREITKAEYDAFREAQG